VTMVAMVEADLWVEVSLMVAEHLSGDVRVLHHACLTGRSPSGKAEHPTAQVRLASSTRITYPHAASVSVTLKVSRGPARACPSVNSFRAAPVVNIVQIPVQPSQLNSPVLVPGSRCSMSPKP
jgi:hypothetical protein